MRDPFTFDLDQPIEFPGQETLNTFTIKPFTGRELLECGVPFNRVRAGEKTTFEPNVSAIRLLLSKMAAVPPSMIDRMSAVDFGTAIEVLYVYFFCTTPTKS